MYLKGFLLLHQLNFKLFGFPSLVGIMKFNLLPPGFWRSTGSDTVAFRAQVRFAVRCLCLAGACSVGWGVVRWGVGGGGGWGRVTSGVVFGA